MEEALTMTSTTQANQRPEDRGLGLNEIEQGLASMWGSAAGEAAGTPAVRVCALNLVVFLADRSLLDTALDAGRTASQAHPLRAILLQEEPEAGDSVTQGEVSGYCEATEAGNIRICCEQIVLTARGRAVDELAASTSTLLVPDVPVVIWWFGRPPFGRTIFERMQVLADYMIIDSRDLTDTIADLRRIASGTARHPEVGVGDLNWPRITPWRELIADIFDDTKLQPYLGQISRLTVEYSDGEKYDPSQSILFAGWFGSRLKWTPIRGQSAAAGEFDSVADNNSGQEVQVRISPSQGTQIPFGDIVSVKIETVDSRVIITLTRAEDATHLDASIEAEGTSSQSLNFECNSLGQRIANEVEAISPDSIYQASLSFGLDLVTRK
jgi:glucose-6-phosphate dehydrogenase assembly protein OpcA